MTAMTCASRTSGVAPFSVFFDPIGGGTGVVQPGGGAHERDFDYLWEFGDAGSGNWSYMAAATNNSVTNSKNFEVGCVAAHVFEAAGTYPVKLHVIDDSGSTYDYTETITVTAADTTYSGWTKYVSAAGNNANSGDIGAPWLTLAYALDQMLGASGPRRLLLNKGDAFTLPSGGYSFGTATGPYHVGAYGTGALPTITGDHTADHQVDATNVTDLRFVDLDFRLSATNAFIGAAMRAGTNNLMLRCKVAKYTFGFEARRSYAMAQDCEFSEGRTAIVWAANDLETVVGFCMLGCYLHDAQAGTHGLRSECQRSVIAHNKMDGGTITLLKLYAGHSSIGSPVKYMNVMGNVFSGHAMTGWMFEVGPQSNEHTEYIQDILIEGNLFAPAGSGALSTVWVNSASYCTFRNNVLWLVSPTGAGAFGPRNPSAGEDPGNCVVEHISIYQQSSPDSTAYGMSFDTTTSTIYRNNVVYAPGKTIEAPSGTVTVSNTLANNTDPKWTLENSGDFTLEVASPCINAGSTATKTRRDFRRALRDQGNPDQGAFEYGASIPAPAGDGPGNARSHINASLVGKSQLLRSLIQ